MAIAIHGSTTDPNEMPHQQSNNQTQKPQLPTQYNGHPTAAHKQIELFTKQVSQEAQADATHYIEASLKELDTIRIGTFLIELLEKLHAIPAEVSVEENQQRADSIAELEQLLIDHEAFAYTHSEGYDTIAFGEQVTDKIGDDEINQYPVITLLGQAVRTVRSKANRYTEAQLVIAQRVALIGIAKQLGVYTPQTNA